MSLELKTLAIKLLGTIAITPLMGFLFLRWFEYSKKVWKTNNRRKRWYVMCGVFFVLAGISGWLR
jgi:hypothetical protein